MVNIKKNKEIKEVIFIWEAKDKRGKTQKGEMRAVSDAVVRVMLRSKGLKAVKIKRQYLSNARAIKQSDIAIFTRQLSTMMKAGVPLLQSFEIVANGHINPSVSKLLYDIRNDVEQGSSLAQAFAKHPNQFDDLYCNLIDAGEKAGILEMILERLAIYQEKIQIIKSKIKSAMFYPIAVLAVATIVTAILMIFVVPSFKQVFESFGAELPGPTQFVMSISDFFVDYWYYLVISVMTILFLFKRALKTNISFRHNFERFLLKLPILGKILHKSAVARWARTLATMFAAGVPLVEALSSVAGAAGNIVYYNATKKIQKEVETGQSLTTSMQEQNLFPNMMIQMAQIGEESGSLDSMLNKVAEFYEGEVDDAVSSMSSLIEPLIISFLGIIVGGLVVAMYLPIFKMAGTV